MTISLDQDWSAAGDAARWDGARELWVGVLLQAMTDAAMPANDGSRAYPEHEVLAARRWLLGIGSPWTLALALAAADLDHDTWRSRCLPRLLEQWRAADAGAEPRRRCRQSARAARRDAIQARAGVQAARGRDRAS